MQILPRVSIFGLGYVGSVTAACFASQGASVIGVDVHAGKVAEMSQGVPPISEPGLAELLGAQHRLGRVQATRDAFDAVRETEISIVCVGTPSLPSGALDLSHVELVTKQIAEAVSQKSVPHILIFRSTMLPGSTRSFLQGVLQQAVSSGKLSVFFFPEFLRQGSALQDFLEPSLSAIGAENPDQALPLALQNLLPIGTDVVPYEEAELLKYACNAFHALKVSFANEIGRIGKTMSLDSARVMSLLCRDTRLNISPYYLRPGTPFGGSCLPKDVSALSVFARNQETSVPVIDSLLPSNERHLQALLEIVENRGSRKVFLLGLAFKAQTDDLRGSAMLELAAALLLKDFTVRIFDPLVSATQLIGANERFARLRLPNLTSILTTDLAEAMETCEVIVASKPCVAPERLRPLLREQHHVIDINGWPELAALTPNYEGFCW